MLGIDAASASGWAVVDTTAGKPRLVSYGRGSGKDHASVIEVVENAAQLGAELAAVESPYIDKNPDTAIKLGIVVGRWLQELDRARIPWGTHKAQQWQHHLLNSLITPASPREQRKRAMGIWVRAEYGITVSEDEADAIGIASWRAKAAHLEALISERLNDRRSP